MGLAMTTIVEQNYDIQRLARQVKAVDRLFKEETAKAVNRNLTARNWLIGYYIVNYEQQGCDRAQYGEQVLKTLADRLAETSLSYENLKVYRRFYIGFPELSSPIRNYIAKQPQLQTSLLQGMPLLAMSQIGDLANPQLAMQKIGDSKSTQLQTIEPDLAQLNMYVAYYKKNMMQTDDNPPIGILLCTDAGPEQVEYATAGMDQKLFVSKYLLRLPPKETLTNWINSEIERYNEAITTTRYDHNDNDTI